MSLEVTIDKRFEGFTLHADFTAGNTAAAILGASGCGKSMTLRCIAGVVKPDSGRIVLDGRVLFDSEKGIDLPPQQRNVGLLFQNYALFPNMTVEQNILCALKKEKDPAARKAACGSALRAMRLEELAHRLPSELSGGQQQRAALARILAGRPRILMLDEPFSALDGYLREEVEGEVGSLLSNFDGTALLVTHDRDEAYRLCREMIVMDSGEVLRAGTTKEVFADPRRLTAARLTPIMPEFESDSRSFGVSLSMRLESCGKISLMAMAPSTSDFSMPMGMRISVTFAGHGVMKKQPICSFGRPVFCMACCFAILAAVSMGDKSGRTWSQRSGKRTRIKRTTAGQAELMTGRCKVPASIRRRVASLTSSAAPETSMTSSNPSFLRPDKT